MQCLHHFLKLNVNINDLKKKVKMPVFCLYLDVLRKIWTLLYSVKTSGLSEALDSRHH